MKKLADSGRSTRGQAAAVVPPLLVVPETYAKLQTYVYECDVEISGLGLVDYVDGALVVSDVYLLPQVCSSASTDIAEEDLAIFLDEFVSEGGDPRRIRLHWHSHARSPVFWSGTDRDTQLNTFRQAEWYVFLVMNHAGDTRAALHVNYPVAGYYDPLPVRLQVEPERRDELRDEITEKVRTAAYSAWYKKTSTGWARVSGADEDRYLVYHDNGSLDAPVGGDGSNGHACEECDEYDGYYESEDCED